MFPVLTSSLGEVFYRFEVLSFEHLNHVGSLYSTNKNPTVTSYLVLYITLYNTIYMKVSELLIWLFI